MLVEQTKPLMAVLIVENDDLIGLSDLPFPMETYASVGIIYASGLPPLSGLRPHSSRTNLAHQAKRLALHQIAYYQGYLAEHPALYYGVMEGTAPMIARMLTQANSAVKCFRVIPSYLRKAHYEQQQRCG